MIELNGKTGFLRIEHRRAGIGRLMFVENGSEAEKGSVRPVGAMDFEELVKVYQHLPIRVEIGVEHFEQGHTTATSILVEYPICTPHSKIQGGLIHMGGGMVPKYVPLSPMLHYDTSTGQVIVDISPIIRYARAYHYGL